MNRPYVFCHMLTSLDGKIMGSYMETPEGEQAGEVFYDIAFGKSPYYKHQGWLSGRVTTDDNFTFYEKPALDENAPTVPEGDYIAKKADMYYGFRSTRPASWAGKTPRSTMRTRPPM